MGWEWWGNVNPEQDITQKNAVKKKISRDSSKDLPTPQKSAKGKRQSYIVEGK